MSELENKCLYYATRLHEGVVYGGGMVMLDQVKGTTDLVKKHSALTGEEKEIAVCAALLHKCFEKKRIAEGVSPLTMDQVKQIAGAKVLSVIQELASEPEDESKTKVEQWKEKAEWAKTLSPQAQEILLAEKIMNFETSRDKPNPKKPLAWHQEYFQTRMIMVDAVKDVNPQLYNIAVKTKNEGLNKILALQQTQSRCGRE
ncbi:MAG: hypothetical protein IKY98_03005 [Alphaproteobacteria bacterium]|nr:hypothetical protein [Alphaproteobacteria bacterium]